MKAMLRHVYPPHQAGYASECEIMIDGADVGGTIPTGDGVRAECDIAGESHFFPEGTSAEVAARWILEQIPGCADLEIEWVK